MPTKRPFGRLSLRAGLVPLAATSVLLAVCTLGTGGSSSGLNGTILTGYGSSGGPTQMAAPGVVNAASGAASGGLVSSFSISGRVKGLFPGKTLHLVLTVKNPLKDAITVTSLTTTVSNASSRCHAKYVKVTRFSGHLHVAAGKTGKTTVKVTMAHSAPNACQGGKFPLLYRGTATEK
ncbi:MAG: hypothetical protein ACLPYW_11515 [Acidimicrobiales bacterium]